jgi:MFS family permease
VSLAFGSVGELLLGTARSGPQISLGLAMDGASVLIIGIALLTARMRLVPREQLGRMTGGYQTVIYGAGAVGTLVGGLLADASGRLPYVACAVVYAALLATCFGRVRGLDAEPVAAAGVVAAQSPVQSPGQSLETLERLESLETLQRLEKDETGIRAANGVATAEVVDQA